MENKRIFIVEDDPIIASDLQGILTDLGYTICGVAHQPFEAKKKIESEKPNLLLLDINLNSEIDGIDLATLLKNYNIPIIFISAFTDKSTLDRVKQIQPLGYIIKPFNEKEIAITIDLAFHTISQKENSTNSIHTIADGSIFIRTGNNNSQKLRFEDILVMEAYDNYAYIHTTTERLMVSFTLKDLEQKMTAPFLLRVHRSFIVNTKRVEAIHNSALIIGKHEIPIGKSYKEEVLKLFPML
ncbi:MAG: response regulator transcription factor [Bacteroidetes bacterium]|nr:response regulator transcription factor [Bacteroidota bacterium]